MEVHIEGRQASIEPPLLGWIAERLDDLTILSEDISLAHVTLVRHTHWRRSRTEVYIVLRLGRTILEVAHRAKTPYAAAYAAMKSIESKARHAEPCQRQAPLTLGFSPLRPYTCRQLTSYNFESPEPVSLEDRLNAQHGTCQWDLAERRPVSMVDRLLR